MKKPRRVLDITPSLTLSITDRARKMKADGIPVVGFGSGEPDFDTPDFIKKAAIKAIEDGHTKYTPASGLTELKEEVCKKLLKENGLKYKNENVIISCGAKHTIYNIVQALCEEGDEVLIPSPYWLSYPEMVKLAMGTPVFIDTKEKQNFKITVPDLEKHITKKTKILILNSPSNPTGSVYSKDELKKIACFLEDKDIYIISDEIYEKIIYDKEHVSIASLSDKIFKKTIVVNGHSKVYAMTGWRIGYMAGPREIAEIVDSIQGHSTSNPTSISQWAAIAAFRGDQSCITKMVSEFKKRRDYMVSRFNSMDKISCLKPDGAFYVFANISKLNKGTSMEVSEKLLEEAQVAVVPGIAFGADDYIRLSYATSFELIQKGMDKIEKWLK